MAAFKYLFLILVLPRTFADHEECHPPSDVVRIKGNSYAGVLEVCSREDTRDEYEWWPVCGGHSTHADTGNYLWDDNGAETLCKRLNFTDPSHQDHQAYMAPCSEVNCFKLSCSTKDCLISPRFYECDVRAAIACDIAPTTTQHCSITQVITQKVIVTESQNGKPNSQFSPKPEPQESMTNSKPAVLCSYPTNGSHSTNVSSVKQEHTNDCAKLGGALGVVAGLMALILFGVILGWILSFYCRCSKNKNLNKKQDNNPVVNPIYDCGMAVSYITPSSVDRPQANACTLNQEEECNIYDTPEGISTESYKDTNGDVGLDYEVPLRSL